MTSRNPLSAFRAQLPPKFCEYLNHVNLSNKFDKEMVDKPEFTLYEDVRGDILK